jgi:hypothetical protein
MRWIVLACLLATPAALAQDAALRPDAFLWKPTDSAITIHDANKLVVSIHMDGSVEFGEGFTADDVSREFWKYLGQSMPNKCEAAK